MAISSSRFALYFAPKVSGYYRHPSSISASNPQVPTWCSNVEQSTTSSNAIESEKDQVPHPQVQGDDSQACNCLDRELTNQNATESNDRSDQSSEHVPHHASLATFRELYHSRDGRITVFEDHQGHLTSVDSSRLV